MACELVWGPAEQWLGVDHWRDGAWQRMTDDDRAALAAQAAAGKEQRLIDSIDVFNEKYFGLKPTV